MENEIKIKPYGEEQVAFRLECNDPPITSIWIGKNPGVCIGVDKKFNWFQKKMIKWCFGFEVKENR